jgi:hypothetical protein
MPIFATNDKYQFRRSNDLRSKIRTISSGYKKNECLTLSSKTSSDSSLNPRSLTAASGHDQMLNWNQIKKRWPTRFKPQCPERPNILRSEERLANTKLTLQPPQAIDRSDLPVSQQAPTACPLPLLRLRRRHPHRQRWHLMTSHIAFEIYLLLLVDPVCGVGVS